MTPASDASRVRAQRAFARLAARPGVAGRYAGELSEFQELVDAQVGQKASADDLSDVQLDRIELFVDVLRNAVNTRKQQAELQVRQWKLYERELDEVTEAVKKKRRKPSPPKAQTRAASKDS
jgi:hypothetical protein